MHAHENPLAPPEPTPRSSWVFAFKATCFQVRRLWQDWRQPVARHPKADALKEAALRAEWCSDLLRDGSSPRERLLQLGKVQNLRVAAKALNGIEVPPTTRGTRRITPLCELSRCSP
ncbi:MAG TPA: hypothetical protein VD994_15390 [Prosthecobacter sp.]|nr:hypothetical protein [Prosthecobacter sp.]